MLQLSAAGKRFGPKLLFEDANWLITPDERTGLVGGNGTGKSTLLKILAGLETLDYGAAHARQGHDHRLPPAGRPRPPRQDRLRRVPLRLRPPARPGARGRRDHPHPLHRRPRLPRVPAPPPTATPTSPTTCTSTTSTPSTRRSAPCSAASASPKKTGSARPKSSPAAGRCASPWPSCCCKNPACCCSTSPPTISTSRPATGSKNYLHDYPNAYILISHDRYFLDVTVNKTIEIWNKRLHTYHGNYEKYLLQKEERRTQLMSAYKNQRDRIDALEAFINRFRYQATKAKQVQSRIKELDKIERIEVPEEEATIHFTIPQPPASGRTVIEVSHLSKNYPMPPVDGGPAGVKHVLQDVSFQIDRGDRIALVGANGAGKSTLIRMLSGLEPPTSGKIKLGHNVLADYFAQDQYKVLDPGAACSTTSAASRPRSPSSNCARCSAASCSPATTYSSRSASSPAASATATPWPRCWYRPPTCSCSTSPPTTSTCAPKMYCSKPSPTSPARCSSSPTTATSSTAWPRASSRSKTTASTSTPATTRTTCGANPAARRKSQSRSQIL